MSENEDGIAWTDEPAPRPADSVLVVRPKPGETLAVVLLGERMWGCLLHWAGDRTLPHIASPGHCPWCEGCGEPYWKGFIAAFWPSMRRRVVAEVTSDAAWKCPRLMNRQDSLRGLELQLIRKGRYATARVRAVLSADVVSYQLPPSFDPRVVLARMWRMEALRVNGTLTNGDRAAFRHVQEGGV